MIIINFKIKSNMKIKALVLMAGFAAAQDDDAGAAGAWSENWQEVDKVDADKLLLF